jgi:hypothetical protein
VREFVRSNLLGLIAIFIALGGTAIALPGRNTVDSGDIENRQVKAQDLARRSVTRAKLRPGSIDSSKVVDDSLTGRDIDESTLDLTANPTQRTTVISPAELTPSLSGEPEINLSFNRPAVFFNPSTDNRVGATLAVPADRLPGSNLQVSVVWDANGTGNATWASEFATLKPGPVVPLPEGADVTGNSPAVNTEVETAVLTIPAGAVQNGDVLSLKIARNADAPSDTLPVFALLRAVEIRYTADG